MSRLAQSLFPCIVVVACGLPNQETAADQPPAKPEAAVEADSVLLGGKILTVDAQDGVQQALAIRGGRILAVGRDDEIAARIGKGTEVIRLEGKTVVPGIIESHVHAIGAAREPADQPYAELSSIAQVQDWIRRRAGQLPPGTWIEVPRTDITRLAERRHPTPAELDAASTTHPVAFEAARKWALNTLGFRTAGVTSETVTVPGGKVLRDDAGRPRLIVGGSALIRRFLPWPKYTEQQDLDALERLLHRYNEVGITGIGERATDRNGYRLYRALIDRGCRIMRVALTFRRQMRTADEVTRFAAELGLKPGEGDEWVKVGPLKITVDGGIHWGNTHLSEPYGPKRAAFYVLDDPEYRGDLSYTVDQMRDVFAAGHRLGWQMCCHVTGDAGVERVLDALEAADRQVPLRARRFTLSHAYFPTPEAAQRAGRLGVCVDTQPYLYYKDSDAIAEVYGTSWAERFIGLCTWKRGGVPTAINSDHMIGLDPDHAMNSFNPFLQMAIAVSRKNEQGRVYGADQRLSRMDALRAMTANAAYLYFNEKETGSIEAGKLADLVVLDRDYLTCPEDDIREVKVLMTFVNGKIVYRK